MPTVLDSVHVIAWPWLLCLRTTHQQAIDRSRTWSFSWPGSMKAEHYNNVCVCVLIRARAWWDMYVIAQRSASCGRNEVHRFERRRPAVGLKRLSAGSRDSLSQRGQWWATTERGAPAQLPRIFCTAPSTELRRFSRKRLAGGIKLTRAALSEKPRSSSCVPAREGLWGYQPTAPSHLEDPPSAPWD